VVATRTADGARDPEVGDHRVPVGEQHVLGLHVPVDEPLAVGVVQARPQLLRDPQRVLERQPSLAREPLSQRFPAHVGHHVVEGARGLAGVEQREHVRVGEPRGDRDLSQEPLGADRGRDVRAQHLDRHLAVVAPVVGDVHGRHAAAAQHAVDRVAIAESGRKSVPHRLHRGKLSLPAAACIVDRSWDV